MAGIIPKSLISFRARYGFILSYLAQIDYDFRARYAFILPYLARANYLTYSILVIKAFLMKSVLEDFLKINTAQA